MTFQQDQEVRIVNYSAPLIRNIERNKLSYIFERLELTMKDRQKSYIEKVESLLSVLERVLNCLSDLSKEEILFLFEFIYKHTLTIILHGDWLKKKVVLFHMRIIFKRFEVIANKRNLPTTSFNISYILELLDNPWGCTVQKILNKETCTDKELLDFVKGEIGFVFTIRLEIMIAARCDSQALQLIEICLQCIHNPEHCQLLVGFLDEINTIKDIYLLLLVKANDHLKLSNEISKMRPGECLNLVYRCTKEGYLTNLKKSLLKMVEVVTNMVLASAMVQPVYDEINLEYLIKEWCNLYTDTCVLFHLVKLMSLHAVSSYHIYLLVEVLVDKYGILEKSLCIELFIRAFTLNLNEIEKHKSDLKHEMVKKSEAELSSGFLSLADYLKDDIFTSRECVLTSYSLNPTSTCYEKITKLAILSGTCKVNAQNDHKDQSKSRDSCSNCHTHEFVDQHEIDPYQTQHCKTEVPEVQNFATVTPDNLGFENPNVEDALSNRSTSKTLDSVNPEKSINLLTPICISDADHLGITQTLCDDLSTVISSGRYQLLNWNLDWTELSSRCQLYKTSGKQVRSSEKELNYLKIDYNQFKDLQKSTQDNDVFIKGSFDICGIRPT